eukprot:Skav223702  [mRNA]  locus=scaffold1907:208133:209648:+ [translate_table: standard]
MFVGLGLQASDLFQNTKGGSLWPTTAVSGTESRPDMQHGRRDKFYTNAMALVVLADAYCTCWDIDARAAQVDAGWIPSTMSDVCLALYTMELAMSFLVSGVVLCKDWVQIDLFVVICGYVEAILSELVARWIESFTVLRVLRIMRIIRLSRLLRKTRALRELQKLVRMMATCLRALMWSFEAQIE